MIAVHRPILTRETALAVGSKRYFTGKPCILGHVAERFTVNQLCDACRAENAKRKYYADIDATRAKQREGKKRWRVENRELDNARCRAWRINNAVWAAAYHRTYYLQHRERMLQQGCAARLRQKIKNPDYDRTYYRVHREKRLAQETVRYASRPEHFRSIARERRVKHPERVRAADSRKRAARMAAPGHHSATDINEIRQAQRDRCAYCPKKLALVKWHVDHIQPLSRGGSNDRRNLQILCAPCNQAKYAKDPIDFARSLGRLL